MTTTNIITDDRMTLVLSAPSIHNSYYKDKHTSIINFMIEYANAIIGHDNVVVIADKHTMPCLEGKLPGDVLLEESIEDIWMRDFTTVIPGNPVQFKYRPSYFDDLGDAVYIQQKFRKFMNRMGIIYSDSDYILDGGNVVDNYTNAAIVTRRFLEDNDLSLEEGREALKTIFGVEHVAIIPYDDEQMGHADGMLMWTSANNLLVNRYEEPFRSELIQSLEEQLPSTVEVSEVEVSFNDNTWEGFSSACGIHLNSTVTQDHIYMPVFNSELDAVNRQMIRSKTDKMVHQVDASGVCEMGGSLRCLTWQLQGVNAERIVMAARRN